MPTRSETRRPARARCTPSASDPCRIRSPWAFRRIGMVAIRGRATRRSPVGRWRTTTAIRLEVMSVDGRRVRILARGLHEAGLHGVTWNGLDDAGNRAPPGVYFFRLAVNDRTVDERRVTVVK